MFTLPALFVLQCRCPVSTACHWKQGLHFSQQLSVCHAGAVVLPSGGHFPGTATAPSSSPGKRPTFFATAGENGVIKIWSSATAGCVYVHKGGSSTAAGNYTWLAILPGAQGLLAATADCNLRFLHPQVLMADQAFAQY